MRCLSIVDGESSRSPRAWFPLGFAAWSLDTHPSVAASLVSSDVGATIDGLVSDTYGPGFQTAEASLAGRP